MARFDNIIVAVDGSGAPEQMMQILLKLPLFASARITLLHAVPSQIGADTMRSAWEQGQKLLANSLQSLVVKPGTTVVTQIVEGDPKLVVLEMAESLPNPLVIMGSRGRNRLAAILENSVSQYLFQLASCPMLLIKDGIFLHQTKTVMVALDRSAAGQRAFETGLEIVQNIPSGQLYLARILQEGSKEADDPVLNQAIGLLKREHIPYRTFVTAGDAGSEITRLAAESKVDLLVMGSPDRRPTVARSLPDLDRLLGTSISDYVRVHIECPVLMVRSKRDPD